MTYYIAISVITLALSLIYVFRWHRHVDVNMSVIFLMITMTNIAYLLLVSSKSADAAAVCLKIIYAGGCFLPWFSTMCIANLCKINVSKPVRLLSFIFNTIMYSWVLTIGHSGLFYKGFDVTRRGGILVMHKLYGPLHTAFYICIILYLIIDIAMIFYCYFRKQQVSRRILLLLFLPVFMTMAAYFGNHLMKNTGYELLPASYVLTLIVYLGIARRMALYDISEMVIESMVQSGDTGFISVDLKGNYLGSNETAKEILPALRGLTVDRPITDDESIAGSVGSWIEHFKENGSATKYLFVKPDAAGADSDADSKAETDASGSFYEVTVSDMYDGSRKIGCQIFLEDDTQNQKYIRLLDKYNSELEDEVAAKTERIVEMHDNLILSMATMVESRDNSTGGHIRRTSEGVKILIEEMRKDDENGLSDEFCRDIIKAAPMHDLGKIAVDDAVLRKPGRFTDEEYEKMKQHAAEGARIVHEILKDTDDEHFRVIAENVAHYHHERVDGSGYPEGLKGDEIPLEARIMAIADVYDALVSKRVYKEKMSFEKADSIITEGMGTQFDAGLRKYYEAARPKLEGFYSSCDC